MDNEIRKLVNEINNIKRVVVVKSYKDFEIYQVSYKAALIVIKGVLNKLPGEEKYDLGDQLRRSCKAVPRLIAEGYAKCSQNKGFRKYLDDALAESNETEVGLAQTADLYSDYVDRELVRWLVSLYERLSKQIYTLNSAWHKNKVNDSRD